MATAKTTKKTNTKVGKDTYLWWYENMLLQRRFEEKAGQLYGQQKIRGFLHLYIGQEATSAGMITALRDTDPIITAYRDHGLALARGVSANECMAELYGKVTGCTSGKGGSMHYFSKEKYFFGGHGIVGAQIPLGTGIAFAEKYNDTKNICVCLFGDGAAWQGALHESMNLAALWEIPVIFVVENNNYAMGTAVERSTTVTDIHKVAGAFGIKAGVANGMDVQDVHKVVSDAADYVRKTNKPYFLEVKTYRYKGHSMSDPGKYRTKEEVQHYKDLDPIDALLNVIKKGKMATQKQIDAIADKVKQEVEACVQFAEESPFPPDSDVYTDIYVQEDYPFIKD
jgi:pyruvate dehydrogenase E1 component alpha subunit